MEASRSEVVRSAVASQVQMRHAVTCQLQDGVGFHSSTTRPRGRETLVVVGIPRQVLGLSKSQTCGRCGKTDTPGQDCI